MPIRRPAAIARPALLIASAALVCPAHAESAPPVPSRAEAIVQTVVASLGSLTLGVAWQVTEFDISPDSDCCTTSMSNGFEPSPVIYVQIPVRMLTGTERSGIGYTVRMGYRQFRLKRQDLGGTGDEQNDYGTRVSGRAFHLTPMLVGRVASGPHELSAGLGLGLGLFSADGNILVRRTTSGPPFSVLESEPVNVSTFASSLGALMEYRFGPIVAAMETAIMQGNGGGKSHELGISAFSVAYRLDF